MKILIQDISKIDVAAKEFLSAIKMHKVIAFTGEMGAGKTTFIKALCKQLGVKDTTSSPTFSLVNEYQNTTGQKIYHFDFYRLRQESEALDMGCEEYFYSGNFCFVEWPEKIPSLLPIDCLHIQINVVDTLREIIFD